MREEYLKLKTMYDELKMANNMLLFKFDGSSEQIMASGMSALIRKKIEESKKVLFNIKRITMFFKYNTITNDLIILKSLRRKALSQAELLNKLHKECENYLQYISPHQL